MLEMKYHARKGEGVGCGFLRRKVTMDISLIRTHFSKDPGLYLFWLCVFPSRAFIAYTEASFNRQRNFLRKFSFFQKE